MGNQTFDFKRFSVGQEGCGMKVGTDGVLLGAWARGGLRVLDIGTGTGLLALMMAQRFPQAVVEAIDIDPDACRQARINVAASPFADRIAVSETAFQQYAGTAAARTESTEDGPARFDSIVCNPPFFENSLQNPDRQRAVARHADSLPFRTLFQGVARLLADEGEFSLVIPTDSVARLTEEAFFSGLTIARDYAVKTTARKAPKRHLMAFRKHCDAPVERQEVTLLAPDGNRSAWYAALTEAFYLR